MIWRPWVVLSLAIIAFLLVAMLLAVEQLPTTAATPKVAKEQSPLKTLQYAAGNRRKNFETMGMSFELADATALNFGRFDRQADKFKKILEEQAAELADAFCPSESMAQPYSALAYLVTEENSVRNVVEPGTLRRLDVQPWYAASLVPALYDTFEQAETRRSEATLMAVSAALLALEAEAIEGRSPFARSLTGSWGFSRLAKRSPRIERVVIEYFSIMHFLTELSNGPGGICS